MREPPDRIVVSADVAEFIGRGVALVVAARDADLQPSLTRGWGPVLSTDGTTVSLCLTEPPASAIRSNLESTGVVAMTCTLPTSYRSVQLKGRVLGLGEPTGQQVARAEEHAAAFIEEAVQVGVLFAHAQRFVGSFDLALTFEAHEIYDQTPGPSAGAKL